MWKFCIPSERCEEKIAEINMNKILFLGLTEKSRMDFDVAHCQSIKCNVQHLGGSCVYLKKTVCEFFASAEFDLFGLKWKGV